MLQTPCSVCPWPLSSPATLADELWAAGSPTPQAAEFLLCSSSEFSLAPESFLHSHLTLHPGSEEVGHSPMQRSGSGGRVVNVVG